MATPVKYYVGPAWYQKDIVIPGDWENKKIILYLERPHTKTHLWIIGKEVGIQYSLSVSHIFDVTKYLK